MKIGSAKVCLDCEELFEVAQSCPRCGSTSWWYISRWIAKMVGEADDGQKDRNRAMAR